MNLYEIDDAIMHCFDEETGEIFEAEYLDQLEMLRDQKIENIACWIKNLRSDAEQLKLETDKLTDRRKHTENKAEHICKGISPGRNSRQQKRRSVTAIQSPLMFRTRAYCRKSFRKLP